MLGDDTIHWLRATSIMDLGNFFFFLLFLFQNFLYQGFPTSGDIMTDDLRLS